MIVGGYFIQNKCYFNLSSINTICYNTILDTLQLDKKNMNYAQYDKKKKKQLLFKNADVQIYCREIEFNQFKL